MDVNEAMRRAAGLREFGSRHLLPGDHALLTLADEVERLTKLIKQAPHDADCSQHAVPDDICDGVYMCDCWKRAALERK